MTNPAHRRFAGVLCAFLALCVPIPTAAAETLEQGWANPPRDARLRAYWWWLNGNVTKASITRDLEEMKAKGFGGALICDAGGAEQDGNAPVPHGPTFFTPEWRELYKHTLREADRLGLEMSLNIQSGWNLGGPNVKAEDAAKKLTWSEARVTGPTKFAKVLAEPPHKDPLYRDLFVVAYPARTPAAAAVFEGVAASSSQPSREVRFSADADANTFWVSRGNAAGQGPTRERPEWLQVNFKEPVAATRLVITPRPTYGPKTGEIQASDDGKTFRTVKAFTAPQAGDVAVAFPATRAKHFRAVFFGAYDPNFPERPRNVQVAEIKLFGEGAAEWPPARRAIQNWAEKAMYKTLHFSAPDTAPLLVDAPARPGEEDARRAEVVDLSRSLAADGTLTWDVPAGEWEILRFGFTVGDHSHVSTSSDGWKGYALDVLDTGAFRRYWDEIIEPLIADAGPLAGTTLKYLHTDSWEVEAVNWTPTLREEFKQRRGYDLLPFLPTLAGRIVDDRETTNRFFHDFRRTLGDLAVDNHYVPFRTWAKKHNLLMHPESGGPHASPIDAQQCLGQNDAPMSEFWAESWRHRIGDPNRFFVKQPASAAHTYGHRLVLAEGFTTIGPHWQETVWDNLKPSFDKAICEGLNLLVWHAFVNSPEEMGLPGIQYFAGTHFNPNVTWWEKSGPFLAYINRCQFMMQRGLFVADACYFYGDHAPNFAQLRASDPAKLGFGYDYDVITADAILTRASVRDGQITLPDGMSYRVLVLPDRPAISLPVLRKLKELVDAGATVVGPKPERATGLAGLPESDREVKRLADALWGEAPVAAGQPRQFGKGRVVHGVTARQFLESDRLPPDFQFEAAQKDAQIDYIHRRDGDADIYCVANRAKRDEAIRATFRVSGKAPELWDAVTGERRFAAAYTDADGRTTVPLDLAPCGSVFVVFREPAAGHPATAEVNATTFTPRHELTGAWTVHFDPKFGGPASANFDQLVSWTTRPEPGIRFYSGTATYRKTFDLPADVARERGRLVLDLGKMRELAEVKLNGKSLGVVWAPPFRVDVTDALKPAGNQLEIEVVNFWPNRIIGDDALPAERRITRTNVRKLTKTTPLMESGLLGPVQLLERRP